MRLVRLLLVVSLACTALAAPAADASFPGKNGALVLSLESCYFSRYLVKVPWRGGDLVPITDPCPADAEDGDPIPSFGFPDAGPSGELILAARSGPERGLVTLKPDGSALSPVALPPEVDPLYASFAAPSLAPDGSRFALETDRYRNGYDQEALWEVRLDGSGGRQIQPPADCGPGKNCAIAENPRWSPDGKLIAVEVSAYIRKPRARDAVRPGIWLIRARDGKLVRRLTRHGGDVDWSPDGKRIVYRTYYEQRETEGGASGGNLYVVSRDGRRRRKLVHRHGIAETQPTWSPDGRWIAWVSLEFTSGDVAFDVMPSLWRVRAHGGRPKRIQDLPRPWVEEGEYEAPQLTWLPVAGGLSPR